MSKEEALPALQKLALKYGYSTEELELFYKRWLVTLEENDLDTIYERMSDIERNMMISFIKAMRGEE